jgi:hypothetical protein
MTGVTKLLPRKRLQEARRETYVNLTAWARKVPSPEANNYCAFEKDSVRVPTGIESQLLRQ